jgi:hypothetical protein
MKGAEGLLCGGFAGICNLVNTTQGRKLHVERPRVALIYQIRSRSVMSRTPPDRHAMYRGS